ncbi:MAG: DUF2807 domain-containing protein [Muribaculaceae bacterium]|nr:DUF2807 domain-containing protein [Muribaculaceae bacterium]
MKIVRTFITMLMLLCIFTSNAATPAGRSANSTKEYKVRSFSSVRAYNSIDIRFSQSNKNKVVVNASHESLLYLKVEVDNGTLSLYFDPPKNYRGNLKADVEMSAPTLNTISIYNGCEFEVVTPFNGDNLYIEAFNNADVEFKKSVDLHALSIKAYNSGEVDFSTLKADTVDCEAYNSAEIELAGSAYEVSMDVFNSGVIDASHLSAKTGTAKAYNSGQIKCNIDRIKTDTYNSGKISNGY